uniref:Protein IQ-DOMAIN 31 n=1 Tax=Noccaea caerulescens TaxID=107243 RepID=A0A1J3CBH1_NOCCA
MGRSTKWLKNVLLGKKPSKSSGSKEKERVVSGKEVLVTAKVEESDVVSDLPSFANAATDTVDRSSGVLEKQNVKLEEISDDETQLPEEKPTDVQDNLLSDAERIQQEIAATSVQAAFRGYLARRAFWALKGIIRLQALIRGHLVRRQAVATLCCVMGIVKLQALARGREIRNSDIGVQVHRTCRLQLLQNKLGNPADTDAYMGIKKITANAFVQKLLASSPQVIPVHAPYDTSNSNSNAVWLENWSASCFWKPVPQPKKTTGRKLMNKVANNAQIVEAESPKPKKSVRKVPAANLESSSVQTSFEFEKQKRSFRKVSSKSIEPPAVENPQIELEKVKRSLRKVHNPVVESSIQPQPVPHVEVEKPKLGTEKTTESSYPLVHETVNVFDEKKKQELPEQPEEVHVPEVEVHTPGPLETNEVLDSSMVNQNDSNEDAMVEEKPSMEKDAKEDETPKPNKKENSAGKENQKSKKKSSATNKTEREESNGHHQSSPSIPSYMQATKSAKAKLRLHGSPKSPEQEGTEKPNVPRRHSLPSSGNGRITSQSPRTTRLTNSGGKTRNKKEKPLREGSAKTTPVERKR